MTQTAAKARRQSLIAQLDEAGGPPRPKGESLLLLGVGLACAGASSVAFFLHVLGFLPMPFFVSFFGRPLIVLMMIVILYSWHRRLPFWRRFRAALVAGALGLVAYDLVRFTVYRLDLLDYHPFHVIPRLGALMTGLPPAAGPSIAAGWAYHVWNGFSFAVLYALIAGPARWGWGVAWAMVLETGMLLSYPAFMGVAMGGPFVGVSFIGHIAYGAAVGITVRRLAA